MVDALCLASFEEQATLASLAVLGLLSSVVVALLWHWLRPQRANARELRAVAASLQGGAAQPGTHLLGCHVHGALGGRAARVSFARRGVGEQAHTAIVYDLEVVNPAATFEVAERDARQSLGRFLGLAKGDALDDESLVVRAGGRGAGTLLQATDVRAALQAVFAQGGVSEVSLHWRALRVEQRGPVRATAMLAMLDALRELSRLCGRVPVSELVTVRPRPAAPPLAARFAWTGGGAVARCPYCKDELDATAPEVAPCERCATVHHRDCLAEAGGCTIFGCGARRERARA